MVKEKEKLEKIEKWTHGGVENSMGRYSLKEARSAWKFDGDGYLLLGTTT